MIPRSLSLILIVALLLAPAVSAANPVTATAGDTWIMFSWTDEGPHNLYFDGRLIENGTPLTYYLISDLSPAEQHILEVRNATTNALVGTATASTLPSPITTIFLLLVQIGLMCLIVASRDPSFGILTGGASFVVGTYVLLSSSGQFWAVLISLILLILTGLAVIRQISESISSKRWF